MPPSMAAFREATAEAVIVNRALQEDVDLPIEKKELILKLFHGRDRTSHYRLLGISPNATSPEIRAAYLQRSKEFHPDAFFRKNLGTYGPKIQDLFRRMTNAQDVLMSATERERYDREFQYFEPEELEAITRREVGRIEDEQRAKVRRSHFLQGKGFARLTMARAAMAAGNAALGKSDFAKALHEFQRALDLDPRLDEARTKLDQTRALANDERVQSAIQQAIEKAREGQNERALRMLKSAMQADPSNHRIFSTAATIILRNGGELKEARAHAQRAIDLGDRGGRAYSLLGEILLALGEKKAGKAALQTAVDLGDKRAKAILE
jgi:curved DNA-binding protein CbpA